MKNSTFKMSLASAGIPNERHTSFGSFRVRQAPSPSEGRSELLAALHVYLGSALKTAKHEYLKADRLYYAEIPGFDGVYATGETEEQARAELKSMLEDWVSFRLERGLSLPTIKKSR